MFNVYVIPWLRKRRFKGCEYARVIALYLSPSSTYDIPTNLVPLRLERPTDMSNINKYHIYM